MTAAIPAGACALPHAEVMDRLAARHGQIAELIGGRPVQYVDVPMYANVGDLLIMLGTERFFERHRIEVRRRSAYFNFDLSRVRPDEVVVFQGGGNFGDLYEHPQSVRDTSIERLAGHRVIVMPQSLHFRDPEAIARMAPRYRRHPDFHLCVRDRESMVMAREFTPNVHLLPDMAHQLWPLQRSAHAAPPCDRTGRVLHFIRTDGESGEPPSLPGTEHAAVTRCDWPDFVGRRDAVYLNLCRALRVLRALRLDGQVSQPALRAWRGHVEALAAQAIALFGSHERVVTDRLHGHILSCLLAVPNQVIDNAYGKNSRYVGEWTGASDIVELIAPVAAAA